MNSLQPVHRQVELVPFGIGKEKEFPFQAVDGETLQTLIAADAVFPVHHQISRLEIVQGTDIGLDVFRLSFSPNLFFELKDLSLP